APAIGAPALARMKISPAIPTRTVTIVVMLVRLDPGMVLPPLFREMRLLLEENPEREDRRDEYRRGQAPPGSQRKSVVFMAWFPRDRGCGRGRDRTAPDTPCRLHFALGAAARKTG